MTASRGTIQQYFGDQQNTDALTKGISAKDEATVAEIIWVLKCCMSNYSFNSNIGMSDLFCKMFPDSKIAANYRLSYTKAQYVLAFGLKPFVYENLLKDFEATPFTFKFDETTTSQVKKQYDGYVQYHSSKFHRIINQYAGSLFLGHCTAEQLGDHFFEFGEKLKWNINYLLHLGMDGPYVNKKFQRDLKTALGNFHDKTIIDIGTCSLHPVHTALINGLTKISFNYDRFAKELHFFFKYRSSRREDYELANLESELEVQYMVRHVPSRWVSLKNSYVRIDQQWVHLINYFLTYLPKQKDFARTIERTERYQYIRSVLTSKRSQICVNFAIYVTGILENFLIPFQTDEPQVHILYTEIGVLFYKIMDGFVNRKMLLDSGKFRLEAKDLGLLGLSANLKSIHEVVIGTRTSRLVANLEATENIDDLKLSFRACYVEITSYLQSHLPHNSVFLRDLRCISPAEKHRERSLAAIKRTALTVAKVLKNTNIITLSPEMYADEIRTQYLIYQSEGIEIPKDVNRIDDYWNIIRKIRGTDGDLKFEDLSVLALTCASISHGNAAPERGFSENKIILDGRESLDEETIVALRLVRDSVRTYGGINQFPINHRLLHLVQNSHQAYQQNQILLQEEKKMNAEKQKEVDFAQALVQSSLVSDIDILDKKMEEEQAKIEASNKLLNEGQSALQNALRDTKIKRSDIVRASGLISISIENSTKAAKQISKLTQDKQHKQNKQKKLKKTRNRKSN